MSTSTQALSFTICRVVTFIIINMHVPSSDAMQPFIGSLTPGDMILINFTSSNRNPATIESETSTP